MIPDKIYIPDFSSEELSSEWYSKPVATKGFFKIPHIEYIRKDALLEWARKEANKSFNSFAREELGMEAREKGLAFERLIKHIESL